MKLSPAEKEYARVLKERHPGADWRDILDSPQFKIYSGMYRARGWERSKRVNDGTLAKVFRREPEPVAHEVTRLCARCGLGFLAFYSHAQKIRARFCLDCST